MLNELYNKFDLLVEKNNLYKVEAIGDGYMCIGGAHTPKNEQFESIGNMALDMMEAVKEVKTPLGEQLHLRIGIHTGSVYGGKEFN